MKTNHVEENIDTTLGDLIIAVNDTAFEFCEDKRRAYILAGFALEEILKKAYIRGSKTGRIAVEGVKEKTIH